MPSGIQNSTLSKLRQVLYGYTGVLTFTMLILALEDNILLWRRLRNKRKRREWQQLKLLLLSLRPHRYKGPNKVRNSDWWNNTVVKHFTDKDFYENFRMSKYIFKYICDQLRERLTPKENLLSSMAKKISVEKKVALCLYYLASFSEYRDVGNQFGIHKSTVWRILHEFVDAVLEILTVQFISMPNEKEAIEISAYFETLSHIPNILGAIGRTHIPVSPPSEGYDDFINSKCWPSMILQGIVDHKYRFRNVSIKHPGSTQNAVVLKDSYFYKNHKTLIPKNNIQLNGHELPYIVVGGPTYPSLPWLLKEHTSDSDTEEDLLKLKGYINSLSVCVANAFDRLKARWRTLLKRTDVHSPFVPKLVTVCCTLHNLIETLDGKFVHEWMTAVNESEKIFPQP